MVVENPPTIEQCLHSITLICEGNGDSPEELQHKADLLYLLNRLDFFKDVPVLIKFIEYEKAKL